MARTSTTPNRFNRPANYNGNGEAPPTGNVNSPLPPASVPSQRATASPAIDYDFVNPEYSERMPQWRDCRAAVEGLPALMLNIQAYLIDPTPLDECEEARSRYSSYIRRAVYLNATGRTKTSLMGIALTDWPEVELPDAMQYLKDDADGAGLSIYGLTQVAVGENLEVGRGGLFVDYPARSDGDGVSLADQQAGTVPRVLFYKAEDIRDWAFTRVGNRMLLSFVKLYEVRQVRTPDGLAMNNVETYRILRLQNGVYTVEVLEKGQNGSWESTGQFIPRDGSGANWGVIPFQFIGPEVNQAKPAKPPLYDLAQVNLGHYRNSADFEESAFMLGQPQVTMTGLDSGWRDHLEESGVYFGSRRVLMGPVGSQIGLLQVAPNTLAREAMKDKETQMSALGARLIQPGQVTKTADQNRSETKAAYSVLSLVCDNVSQAIKQALLWAQQYMAVTGDIDFSIDTKFDGLAFDPAVATAVMSMVQGGVIPEADAWRVLRQLNIIDPEKTDDEIREELEAQKEQAAQMNAALGLNPDGTFTDPTDPAEDEEDDQVVE